MKTVLKLTLLLLISISCVSQESKSEKITNPVLDSIIQVAKLHSVYTKKVNWKRLEKDMHAIKEDSIHSIIAPVKHMLKELGDTHGYLMINNRRYAQIGVKHNIPSRKTNPKIAQELYQRMAKRAVNYSLLEKKIAYIEIPMVINNNHEIMNKIRQAICELNQKNPLGWIIDLRANMGGNLYPMAAGIGQLLPNLPFGGGTKDGQTYHLKWKLEKGNFYMNDIAMTEIPLDCKSPHRTTKIAVLTSRYTASSGEALASGFKGQKDIKIFGEQTIGASTTINWYPINDTITFCPTVDFYMSENKTVHKDGIIPDTFVQEQLNPKNLMKGKTINTAIQWLTKN